MKTPLGATLALLVLLLVGPSSLSTSGLPQCRVDQPAPTRSPDGPPSLATPTACRAIPTLVQRVVPVPSPGYHHLGATTREGWSGVLGRLEVGDSKVRAGSHDFVAARFMAKAPTATGVAWLEAGWAETGWSGKGKQRIYTYDTNSGAWSFYDQYGLKPGDRIWIYLQTESDNAKPAWQAWLWWGDGWQLLTSEELPLTGRAQIEQYVEVHGADPIAVPAIGVDNVQLKDGPAGPLRYWRDDVPTAPGAPTATYCLAWATNYDTWSAGRC